MAVASQGSPSQSECRPPPQHLRATRARHGRRVFDSRPDDALRHRRRGAMVGRGRAGKLHDKTPAIMAALRNIAINPRLSLAAIQAGTTYAEATRLWNEPRSWALGAAGPPTFSAIHRIERRATPRRPTSDRFVKASPTGQVAVCASSACASSIIDFWAAANCASSRRC